MTKASAIESSETYDVAAIAKELRAEPGYARAGQGARTLVREADLRIVLMVIQAGAGIPEHHAGETASVQVLSGCVRLRLPDRIVDLRSGQLLVLAAHLKHDVQAIEDSAFLITFGWRKET
jgi:quercetin dioxygenase-like cupin family protein